MRSLRSLLLSVTSLACSLFAAGRADAADRSKDIFDRLCAQCHGAAGLGMASYEAPSIAGLSEWYVKAQLVKFRDGARGTHPQDIAGTRMAPMARFLRQDSDLDAVSQYVAKLKREPAKPTLKGSLVKGEQRYQVCAACHGADGAGIKETGGPRLAGTDDWYLLTQLKNFKSGARGGDAARDPMGAAMRANALVMDDQAMLDVVAYINTLGGN